MHEPAAFVLEARIALSTGVDPATVGAAVTTELCGRWEHQGPCRWPHNSAIEPAERPARFRTLFIARADEESVVRERIVAALAGATEWDLLSVHSRPVAPPERALAKRLLRAPG